MDIDQGRYKFSFIIYSTETLLLDVSILDKDHTQKVRLIPYVLVPGMDTTPHLFHKAQATLAKQAAAMSSPSTSLTARKTHLKRLFHSQQGMCMLYHILTLLILS